MRCYRARCILKESIIRRTRDSEEEYDTFFDEKNQLINESMKWHAPCPTEAVPLYQVP